MHFIIAGFQRCGTSWLRDNLELHPDVEIAQPTDPEPKYFLGENLSAEEYSNQYFTTDLAFKGEKSTSYSEIDGTAAKIKATLGDVKVILCMRDPVYRAISNYDFSVKNGFESRPIQEVFTDSPAPLPDGDEKYFRYIDRGYYFDQLIEFVQVFEQDLSLISYEGMRRSPEKVIQQTLGFIGADPNKLSGPAPFNAQDYADTPEEVIDFLKEKYAESNEALRSLLGALDKEWI